MRVCRIACSREVRNVAFGVSVALNSHPASREAISLQGRRSLPQDPFPRKVAIKAFGLVCQDNKCSVMLGDQRGRDE